MDHAWIDGRPVALDAAIAAASGLLATSRLPVIAGLGTDVAGARAAITLAERTGAAIDHMHSDPLLRDLDVVREAGMMLTTANETRLRADLLLLVGSGPVSAWPELPTRLFTRVTVPDAGNAADRRIVWLCPGGNIATPRVSNVDVQTIGGDPKRLPGILAALRARIAGRPLGNAPLPLKTLEDLVAELQSARFGVAAWSAAELDVLTIEMVCGVVKDLNARTRFSGLPLPADDNAMGVLETAGWMTGFPVRTGFGRGFAEHDPWRFDANRLVESGEADCALWISAYRAVAPQWRREVPMIALTGKDTNFHHVPRVRIAVGHPGVDHDAVEYVAGIGALAAVAAARPTDAVPVARVIREIGAALPNAGERQC